MKNTNKINLRISMSPSSNSLIDTKLTIDVYESM